MTTLFGQLRHWGLPGETALAAQYLLAAAVLVLVTRIWFQQARDPGRGLYLAALVSVGAILVTPYAYAYEMAALAPAALWLALEPNRFQRFSTIILMALWVALVLHRFLPTDFILQLPFWISAGVFALLLAAAKAPVRAG